MDSLRRVCKTIQLKSKRSKQKGQINGFLTQMIQQSKGNSNGNLLRRKSKHLLKKHQETIRRLFKELKSTDLAVLTAGQFNLVQKIQKHQMLKLMVQAFLQKILCKNLQQTPRKFKKFKAKQKTLVLISKTFRMMMMSNLMMKLPLKKSNKQNLSLFNHNQ